jgi:hypothetical protein
MLEKVISKSGLPSLTYKGKQLHSCYDPESEAKKFVQTSKLGEQSLYIHLNPGYGYHIKYLQKLFPKTKHIIFTTYLALFEVSKTLEFPIVYATSMVEVSSFLCQINIDPLAGVQVLGWQSQVFAHEHLYIKTLQWINDYIKIQVININTGKVFSKQWKQNATLHCMQSRFYKVKQKSQGLLLLLASGPSLALHTDNILNIVSSAIIWALPSSLSFCAVHGIKPHCVVQSDGGFWSQYHWTAGIEKPDCILAEPRARLLRTAPKIPIIPFVSCEESEKAMYTKYPQIPYRVPDNGSVAFQAIYLARHFHNGPILILGLDLASLDLRNHVRPHSFDSLYYEKQNRLHSLTLNEQETQYIGSRWLRSKSQALVAESLPFTNADNHIFQIGPSELCKYTKTNWPCMQGMATSPQGMELQALEIQHEQ